MLLYFLFLLYCVLPTKGNNFSACPSFGKYGFRCSSYDYCNKSLNLVCNDGVCGRRCPLSWTLYGNETCLSAFKTLVNYSAAYEACQSQNANLVSIQTDEKMELVRNMSNALRATFNITTFWIGMTVDSRFSFSWVDGTSVTRLDKYWGSLQPNNYKNSQRNVALQYRSNQWSYLDTESYQFSSYICEMAQIPCVNATCKCRSKTYLNNLNNCVPLRIYNESCSATSECDTGAGLLCQSGLCKCRDIQNRWYTDGSECRQCPFGWLFFDESCYFFNKYQYTYNESYYICQTIGGNLAIVNSTSEFNAIKAFYFEYFLGQTAWIGAKSDGEDYYWFNGEVLEYSSLWCNASLYDSCSLDCVNMQAAGNGIDVCIGSMANCTGKLYSLCEVEKFHGAVV